MSIKYITKEAKSYDDQGLIQSENVTVCDHGDTISIGATEHLKSDLIISDNEINPVGSEVKTMWSVKW